MFFNKHLIKYIWLNEFTNKIIRRLQTIESKSFSNIVFPKCRRFTGRKQRQFLFIKHVKRQINQKAETEISNFTSHRRNNKALPLHLLLFLEIVF